MKIVRLVLAVALFTAPAYAAGVSPELCVADPAASIGSPDWRPASESLDGICNASTTCPTWEPNGTGGVYGSYNISCSGNYSCQVGAYEITCDGVTTSCSCRANSYWDPTCPCECYEGPFVPRCLRDC